MPMGLSVLNPQHTSSVITALQIGNWWLFHPYQWSYFTLLLTGRSPGKVGISCRPLDLYFHHHQNRAQRTKTGNLVLRLCGKLYMFEDMHWVKIFSYTTAVKHVSPQNNSLEKMNRSWWFHHHGFRFHVSSSNSVLLSPQKPNISWKSTLGWFISFGKGPFFGRRIPSFSG